MTLLPVPTYHRETKPEQQGVSVKPTHLHRYESFNRVRVRRNKSDNSFIPSIATVIVLVCSLTKLPRDKGWLTYNTTTKLSPLINCLPSTDRIGIRNKITERGCNVIYRSPPLSFFLDLIQYRWRPLHLLTLLARRSFPIECLPPFTIPL